jgi:hypothetical protein
MGCFAKATEKASPAATSTATWIAQMKAGKKKRLKYGYEELRVLLKLPSNAFRNLVYNGVFRSKA